MLIVFFELHLFGTIFFTYNNNDTEIFLPKKRVTTLLLSACELRNTEHTDTARPPSESPVYINAAYF